MGDITLEHYLDRIGKSKNKNHYRIRNMVRIVNLAISEYRLTAKSSGKYVRDICNKEANYLEERLNEALGKQDERKFN